MTRIALVCFDSGRHDEEAFARDRRRFLAALGRELDLVPARSGEGTEAGLQVVFIASGGCEQSFRRQYRGLQKPVVLLADGRHNSLPAALEISAWVRRQGEHAEIVHGKIPFIAARLKELERFQRLRQILAGRIGVIGRPSDWLIGSGVDRAAVRSRWGTKLVDIGLAELAPRRDGGVASAAAHGLRQRAERLEGVDEQAVLSASRLFPALKAVFRRHRLAAATLRCFDLVGALDTTGCLALALLNDEGLVCGCEGDVPAVFTMLLAFVLTNEHPFLANPAAVDTHSNEVVLAHCTVPTLAVKAFRLQSHFETGRGVALAGAFSPGAATLLKVGGPALDRYFVSSAEVLPLRRRPGLCRTQVRLRLHEPAAYFLRSSLANHHVLIRGDHARRLDGFMQYCGAQRIR